MLTSSAAAPCDFAKSKTFWPASSEEIIVLPEFPVISVTARITARIIVEIAQ